MASGFAMGGQVNHVITTGHYHEKVHQGLMFSFDIDDEGLADNGTLGLRMTTPANAVHILYNGACGGDARIDFYEGTTFSVAGTPFTPIARNRTTDFVTGAVTYTNPTVDALGTVLDNLVVPGGSGGNSSGGTGFVLLDWALLPATEYYLRLTNISGQTKAAHLHINFYEDL